MSLDLENILKISIVHIGRTVTTDPNGLGVMAMIPNVMETLLKPHPGLISDISETRGAVTYIDCDGQILMTPAELMRFAGLRLTPVEYFSLRKKFGIRHQWHEDFYDPETGQALQPRQAFIPGWIATPIQGGPS
jgi:hypothetical protein